MLKLRSKARDLGDDKLANQISFLCLVDQAASPLMSVTALMLNNKRESRRITKEASQYVTALRHHRSQLEQFSKQ